MTGDAGAGGPPSAGPLSEVAATAAARLSRVARLGFRNPHQAAAHLDEIRADLAARGVVSPDATRELACFADHVLDTAARAAEPDRVLRDVASLLRRQPAALCVTTSPSASLRALRRAVAIISASPPLGNLLIEHPGALDH